MDVGIADSLRPQNMFFLPRVCNADDPEYTMKNTR